jgi:hypothetical protein
MTPLTDPQLRAKFLEALREWNFSGFIQWRRRPIEWLRDNLDGCDPHMVSRAMYEHVVNGGEIDQIAENYEEYRSTHPYHYDFRICVGRRRLYVETLFDELTMGPTITIVNLIDV